MILVIEIIGIPLRSQLAKDWVGGIFAFLLFITGVIAGSATSMFINQDFDAHSYIVKPLYWLGIYGIIPSVAIGFIGSAMLRRTNKNGEQAHPTAGNVIL
jgi:hypothetical protein